MHEEVIDGIRCKVVGNRQVQGTENNPRRIRDLPPEEQELFKAFLHLRCCPLLPGVPQEEQGPFWEWMSGQTRPYVPGLPQEEQDFFYQHDYDRWKAGLEPLD